MLISHYHFHHQALMFNINSLIFPELSITLTGKSFDSTLTPTGGFFETLNTPISPPPIFLKLNEKSSDIFNKDFKTD